MTQPDSTDTRARSEKLYFILALTTADHAQVIVQQVESRHGYEAYRRLVEAYDPATSDARFVDDRGYAVRAKDGPRSG